MPADPLAEVGTGIAGAFTDMIGFFGQYIVPGTIIVAIAAIGLTWGIRKLRASAK